ncbi:MrcB family domain-containing protein [Ruegeria hyattellae]|uniref:MrcB family domain-containing protein n=1 Tax=Ruegeria hyattellae TaxID=3233337 RepID=UPI00355AFB99
MLHQMLARLAREFVFERAKPFAGSEFGNFVRHDVSLEAKKRLIFLPYELKVKSSVGAGNWAAVPWVAYFDPLITVSATRGFYVVYLINAQSEEIVLSLNQGTTEVYREFGERTGRQVLRRRAVDLAERTPEFAKLFDLDPIELGSVESLPLGYEAGHSFGRTYPAREIDPDAFYQDLERILSAYNALVDRGGTTPTDTMMEEAGSTDITETRKYYLSRRIERTPNVRKMVLQTKGTVCEACGLDPQTHFGFEGPLKNTPLDVHHAKPISGLAEGESRRYKVPDDFIVLCPTCHRMIHKQMDASDLDQLRSSVRFEYLVKYS